jgi:hypothetical protein
MPSLKTGRILSRRCTSTVLCGDAIDFRWHDAVEFSLNTETGRIRLLPLSLFLKLPNLAVVCSWSSRIWPSSDPGPSGSG